MSPRRSRLHVLGAAALAGVLLLTGCTSAVDQATGGSRSDSDAAAVDGGILRLATSAEHVPAAFYQGADPALTIAGLVYDSLIDYEGDSLEPQPSLATSWEYADDGTSITVQLRDDVTFHTGRPMTSKDVEFSLRTYADPARAGQMASTAAAITGFDTSDEHAITLTLAHPISNLFDLLDVVPIIDSKSMDGFDDGSAYIGTGAFTFVSWTPGSGMVFKANEDYWGGAPKLDGVELKIIPDPQTQTAQLRAGQVEVLLTPNNRDLAAFDHEDGFDALTLEGVERSYYAGLNVKTPALEDVRVRQAINYAIDRQRILDEVFLGRGRVANLPWPEFSPAYDADADSTYDQDLDKAKALLAEAGDVPPVTVSYTSVLPMQEPLALILKDNLEAVGLIVKLDALDAAAGGTHLMEGTFPGIWLYPHAFAQYTPATLTVSAYPFNAQHNASNYVDADYQADADAAWKLTDPEGAKAKGLYGKLNDDLLKGSFVLDLVSYSAELAVTDKVHDIAWSRRGELDLSDAYLSN